MAGEGKPDTVDVGQENIEDEQMQRSHSVHLNISAEELVPLTSSASVASPPRSNGASLPKSSTGAAVLDIGQRGFSIEKSGKRDSRFQPENIVHLIPLVVFLCYFCLWIASSAVPPSLSTDTPLRLDHGKV